MNRSPFVHDEIRACASILFTGTSLLALARAPNLR
jgi:hypothetical protein